MRLLFSLLFICLGTYCPANTIGVGYYSKEVQLWRYWEINKDGRPEAKILVYNTGGSSVTFFLAKTSISRSLDSLEKVRLLKTENLASDTVVSPVSIPPYAYRVFPIAASDKSGFFDAAFVNGKSCGIMSDLRALPAIKFTHRYYSYDALYGGNELLISKDELISARGKKDKIVLFADYATSSGYTSLKQERLLVEKATGFKKMEVTVDNADKYVIDATSKNIDLHIDPEHKPEFDVEINFTVTKGTELPVLDLRRMFGAGSSGCRMPVFAESK